FTQSRTGARAKKPNIIGDLEKICSQSIQAAMKIRQCAVAGKSFEFIWRCLEGKSGNLAHRFGKTCIKAFWRVQTSADRGSTLRRQLNIGESIFYPGT